MSITVSSINLAACPLLATQDQIIDLIQIKQACVVYFYPKDHTPGCTQEALDFAALQPAFDALGVRVVGVSRDNIRSHERFREKLGLGFDLLADTDALLCEQFGVIQDKMMYGKSVRGIVRSTFLLNDQGQIVAQWLKVKVPGHAEAVLAEAERMISEPNRALS